MKAKMTAKPPDRAAHSLSLDRVAKPLPPADAEIKPSTSPRSAESATGASTVDTRNSKGFTAPPTHRQLVDALLNNPELKRLADSGTAGDNLAKIQSMVLDELGVAKDAEVMQIIGDTEGRSSNDWVTLREQGLVVRDPSGAIRFADKSRPSKFVHLGDIAGDRGPRGFLDSYEVNRLRETAPGVTIVGNRENKVLMYNDLPELERMEGRLAEPFGAYLAKQPEGARENTLANRVAFWLDFVGSARGGLQHHQGALQDVLAKHRGGELNDDDLKRLSVSKDFPVDDLEAVAKHYVEAWKPGGVYFDYLKNSSFIGDDKVTGSDRIILHGGLTDLNITRVPGVTQAPGNLQDWRRMWLEQGARMLTECEENITSGKRINSEFADLINSMWQTTTSENRDMGLSTIYVTSPKEGNNYRAPTENVSGKLREAEVHSVHQGHKPQGEGGHVLEAPGGDLNYWLHDASYSRHSAQISVAAGKSTVLISRSGNELVFEVKTPGVDSPFGRVTRDGFTVDGLVLSGPHRGSYRLSMMDDTPARNVVERFLTEDELAAAGAKAVYGKNDETHQEIQAHWNETLKAAQGSRPQVVEKFSGTKAVPAAELLAKIPPGSSVVTVHAPSRFGQVARGVPDDRMAELMKAAMENIVAANGDKLVAIHGGTYVQREVGGVQRAAPEAQLMDTMAATGTGIGIGIVPPNADPDWLVGKMGEAPGKNSLTYLTAVGKSNEDWPAPVIESGDLADKTQGVRLFLGGSTGLVTPLDAALQSSRAALAKGEKPALVFVLQSDVPPIDAKDVNASDHVARMPNLPSNFVRLKVTDLPTVGDLMKRFNEQYVRAPTDAVQAGNWQNAAPAPNEAHRAKTA